MGCWSGHKAGPDCHLDHYGVTAEKSPFLDGKTVDRSQPLSHLRTREDVEVREVLV